jgi:spore photoproduct lyase
MKSLKKGQFNTIYVEEKAYKYPITKNILQKYSDCRVILIKNYKDVFNRTNQHFCLQKEHQSLILAVKRAPFLYKGPDVCQNFGHHNFYYTSFLLNCIFDCEYCYLQGMYPSANIVAFVNIEDFKNEMTYKVSKEPVFLAASYDTDLIAFHNIIPYIDYFYDYFRKQTDLLVEVRTKSANEMFYTTHEPLRNLIIAFTLTPDAVRQKYERYTPSLDTRIKAVNTAIAHGFNVRLCLDPIIINPDINDFYEPFLKHIFTQINADSILDVGYGFFRMSNQFFKRIEKQRNNSQLFSEDYSVNEDIVSYDAELENKIKENHFKILTKYIKKEKIFTL